MSPNKRDPGVFDQTPSKQRKRKDRRAARDKSRKKAARPLADYKAEQVKTGGGGKVPFTRRIANAFPLFGVIGIREIGLGLALTGGTVAMWPKLRPWGFLIAVAGFLLMRYGSKWLGQSEES